MKHFRLLARRQIVQEAAGLGNKLVFYRHFPILVPPKEKINNHRTKMLKTLNAIFSPSISKERKLFLYGSFPILQNRSLIELKAN